MPDPSVIVISGLPGAGKSTTATLLARRLDKSAHVEADALQRMIVSGAHWPDGSPDHGADAALQLELRLRNACLIGRSFVDAGFTAIVDDIVIGTRLDALVQHLQGVHTYFVMLNPDFDHVRARWIEMGSPHAETWRWIHTTLEQQTERMGLWLNTAAMSPETVADEIFARLDEAMIIA